MSAANVQIGLEVYFPQVPERSESIPLPRDSERMIL
jgi:hypothetical protein